ncbi:acyl-CoA dehydrogenase family protein [Streptomyces endophyticus]|uniref:Acyl-CoA dehydrogenase family protein n=1 Tax=Streptomyces endophyticus TaxID=714166 RepID=A0ABU6F2K4_9ACTN|nr:acyl-CoA dehydrogenase family protein [Streptomyces endophyticus]MEB8338074.1 acyl-CoA dehydrogenase family protein [Streptomyces endophyticus]
MSPRVPLVLPSVAPRDLLDRIRNDAAPLEAERELPRKSVELIRRSGLGALRVPREHGGAQATLVDLFRLVVELAEADSNVAQALRPHFGFVELLISQGTAAERDRWFPVVAAGELFGNAASERGTAHPGEIRTRITKEGDVYRVDGTKFYSTGSLFADHIVVIALDDEERRVRVVLPSAREGVELLDDWDALGQRTTASGTTRLRQVLAYEDEVAVDATGRQRRTHLGPYYQLFLAAVHAGIAKAALADAVTYAREKARAVQHAGVERAVEDPLVQHTVGDIAAGALAAEAVVLHAAGAIDAALATPSDDGITGDPDALHAAAVVVAQAQVTAARSALSAGERLYDVGGASATLREHHLDRHWRNARTVASHNPIAHKARVVGDWLLSGNPPPLNGFF